MDRMVLSMSGLGKNVSWADLAAVPDGVIDGPIIYCKFTDSRDTKSTAVTSTCWTVEGFSLLMPDRLKIYLVAKIMGCCFSAYMYLSSCVVWFCC